MFGAHPRQREIAMSYIKVDKWSRRDGWWQYDIGGTLPNGKPYRYRKVFDGSVVSKREVERRARARANALESGALNPNAKPKLTLAEFWAQKEPQYRVSGNPRGTLLSLSTQANRDKTWRLHISPELGEVLLENINKDVIDGFRLHLSQNTHKDSSNTQVIQILKSILRYAVELEYLTRAPTIRTPRNNGDPKPFEPTEAVAQLQAAKGSGISYELIVLLGLDVGLRACEMCQVKPVHFRRQERLLDVTGRKGGTNDLGMPLTPRLVDALERACAVRRHDQTLIQTINGGRLNSDAIKRMAQTIQAKAGVRTLGPHALRHTFATDLIARNVQLPVVQKLMGHRNIEHTLKYIKVKPDDMRRAIDNLRPAQEDKEN